MAAAQIRLTRPQAAHGDRRPPTGGVVLYGGTFDPIHRGHLALCRAACAAVKPDRVLLMPTMPAYKAGRALAPARDRLEMCRLAAESLPGVWADSMELDRDRPVYMAETLEALEQRFPGRQLYLLLGADAFLSFDSWYRWQACAQRAILLAGARRSGEDACLEQKQTQLARQGVRSLLLGYEPVEVSSTQVRRGEARAERMLEPEVLRYIRERRMYDL